MSALRSLVILLGLALIAGGCALAVSGPRAPGLYLIILGIAVLVGTVFERWRYRSVATRACADWQRTEERLLDPDTGRTLTVFYDPVSGERHYVDDDGVAHHREPA